MKTSSKVGLGFGIILVLAIGTIAFLGMVEADVKSKYAPIDPNSPCRISGTTFDSRAQEIACQNYIKAKQQKLQDDHNWQNSQLPEEARTQFMSEHDNTNEKFVSGQMSAMNKWAANPEWDHEEKCGMINQQYHWLRDSFNKSGDEKYETALKYTELVFLNTCPEKSNWLN